MPGNPYWGTKILEGPQKAWLAAPAIDEVQAVAQRPGRAVTESIMYADGILTAARIDNPIAEKVADDDWSAEYKKDFGTKPSLF